MTFMWSSDPGSAVKTLAERSHAPDKTKLKIMAPTSRLHDAPVLEQAVIPTVRVRLQDALEISKVTPWVFAFAIGRVLKPDRCRGGLAAGPVITDIHPQPAGPGLVLGTAQHPDRRVIAMNLGAV